MKLHCTLFAVAVGLALIASVDGRKQASSRPGSFVSKTHRSGSSGPLDLPFSVALSERGGGRDGGSKKAVAVAVAVSSTPKRGLFSARSIMCYLLCGSRLFQQSMRNTLTNVLIYMARDMDISTSQKGSMLAAIATGYFFTQIPGGALADRFGPKNVMTGALFLSAICCILVPTAGDAYGLKGIWLIMALMGAVQGPMFPTSSVFLSRWMPTAQPGQPDEKAWGTSMLDVGISIGSLLIIPIVTGLAEAVGWQNTFRYVGVASLVFVALWVWLAASTPSECWFISQEELEFLDKNVAKSKPAVGSKAQKTTAETSFIGMPWAMARHPGLWAVFICHIAFNFGAYYLTNVSDISIYLFRLVAFICILNLTSLFTNDFNFAVVAHILQGCPRPRTQQRQISPHVTTCYQPRDPNIESIAHPSRVQNGLFPFGLSQDLYVLWFHLGSGVARTSLRSQRSITVGVYHSIFARERLFRACSSGFQE